MSLAKLKPILPEHISPHRRQPSRALCALSILGAVFAFVTTGIAAAEPVDTDDPAPIASTGCHTATPPPGRTTLRFDADGRSGSYIREIPSATGHPLPVVLDLHGYLEPAELEDATSGFGNYGATHGFITVTPQIDGGGLGPEWNYNAGSADITWLSDLLTQVQSTLCTDERRVYVAGESMGAITSSSMGCQLSERIAAIAPVAGLEDFPWCRAKRPVSVIAFHGVQDPLVAYNGGAGANVRYLPSMPSNGDGPETLLSIPGNAAAWAHRDNCTAEPKRTQVAPDVGRIAYTCPGGADVQLYSLTNGGHVWPGSTNIFFNQLMRPMVGDNTMSINATEMMWDFFQRHPQR